MYHAITPELIGPIACLRGYYLEWLNKSYLTNEYNLAKQKLGAYHRDVSTFFGGVIPGDSSGSIEILYYFPFIHSGNYGIVIFAEKAVNKENASASEYNPPLTVCSESNSEAKMILTSDVCMDLDEYRWG